MTRESREDLRSGVSVPLAGIALHQCRQDWGWRITSPGQCLMDEWGSIVGQFQQRLVRGVRMPGDELSK
jgi:hypothetical protein